MSTPYTFGDSELARERLGLVAAAFEAPTRTLLDDVPGRFRRYVLDLGCGPGYTTALLAQKFVLAQVTGYDAAPAMLAEARRRVPRAWFVKADVTEPLLLPADIVYGRLLLGHLREPAHVLDTWAAALRPGNGILVCEEPVRYRSDDRRFARYEEIVTDVVARTGATLWAATMLDATPEGCTRVLDRVVEHPVPAGDAAAMFWRNAVQWGEGIPDVPGLIDEFRALEADGATEPVTWEIRQTIWLRTLA
ncbi:MAG TPA: methyltransferase domain-containing protein [Acidimicrobiia bacterium]|nr:methyltransferase domain-containing protein [Acidimicrobiia bacterium]